MRRLPMGKEKPIVLHVSSTQSIPPVGESIYVEGKRIGRVVARRWMFKKAATRELLFDSVEVVVSV